MRGRRMASIQAPEKLCPLCRVDMVTHEALVRHIVDDHDTRLECTECVDNASIKIYRQKNKGMVVTRSLLCKPRYF